MFWVVYIVILFLFVLTLAGGLSVILCTVGFGPIWIVLVVVAIECIMAFAGFELQYLGILLSVGLHFAFVMDDVARNFPV